MFKPNSKMEIPSLIIYGGYKSRQIVYTRVWNHQSLNPWDSFKSLWHKKGKKLMLLKWRINMVPSWKIRVKNHIYSHQNFRFIILTNTKRFIWLITIIRQTLVFRTKLYHVLINQLLVLKIYCKRMITKPWSLLNDNVF